MWDLGLVQRHLYKSKVTRTKGSRGSLKNGSLNSMALERKIQLTSKVIDSMSLVHIPVVLCMVRRLLCRGRHCDPNTSITEDTEIFQSYVSSSDVITSAQQHKWKTLWTTTKEGYLLSEVDARGPSIAGNIGLFKSHMTKY